MLKKLLIMLIFFLSLGQFTIITKISDTKVYLFDITAIIFCLYGLIFYIIHIKKFKLSVLLLPFYVFTFIAFISLIGQIGKLTGDELLSASFYLLRWSVYLTVVNLIYNMLLLQQVNLKFLIYLLIYSGLFVAICGFIQLILFPDFSVLDPTYGWDPHKNRLVSTFFDPNFTGGYLTLIFTLMIFSNVKKLNKRLYYSTFFILILAIFLTYSRSTWAMFGVVIFVYGMTRSFYIILLSLIIAFLAYFAVPRIQTRITGITDPNDSASLRLISWKNTWEIAKDNLLLGVGFNTYKTYQIKYGYLDPDTEDIHSATGSDSSFLLILATTGITGFLCFLAVYIIAMFCGKKILIAVLSSLFLQTQFVNAVFYPQILFIWLSTIILCEIKNNKSNIIEIV